MSWPLNTMRPALTGVSRSSSRARVDLPQPLSPTRPSVAPGASDRSTWATAVSRRAGWNAVRGSA